jgi:hypothetical protein
MLKRVLSCLYCGESVDWARRGVISMASRIGATLFQLGGMAATIGFILMRWPGAFSWFGKLPGDIMTEHVIAPFTSMLVISAGLSALSWVFSALIRLIR